MRSSAHRTQAALSLGDQIEELRPIGTEGLDGGVSYLKSEFTNMTANQLAAVLDSLSEPVYVLDAGGELIYANQAGAINPGFGSVDGALERSPGEIAGRYEVYDIQGKPFPREQLPVNQALLGSTPAALLLRVHTRSDGQDRWYRVKAEPIFDTDGQVNYVLSTSQDVTQQIQMEEALRQQVQIIDQLQDAVISTDMDGYILSWNKGAENLFGYSKDEMIGKHIYLLYQEGEDSTVDYRLIAPELNKSKYNLEMKLRNKSGNSFFAHLSLSRLRDGLGNTTGMIVYAMDITAKKRVEEEQILQLQEKTLIARLNNLIASASDMTDALTKVCSELALYLEVPQATTAIFDSDNSYLRIVSEFNPPDSPSAVGAMVPIEGNPGLQELITTKLPLAVPDALREPGLDPMHELFEMRRVKSTLIVPIIIDTRVIGTLNFESFFFRTFEKREIGTVQQIANQIGQVLMRKHAEQELRESESRFRSVVENSPAGIVIVDDSYRLVYVNDQICRITGFTRDELMYNDFRKKLDPTSEEMLSKFYQQRQRGEQVPNCYEFTLIRKDGVKRQLELTASVMKNSSGKMRTIGQIVDVTESQIAEKMLRDSEERFRGLVQNSSDLVSVIDSGFNFQYVSPSVQNILGYEPEELIGKNVLEYMHPRDVKTSAQSLSRLLNNPGDISVLEHRFRHKDGTWCWFESTGSNQLENPAIGGIVGNTREITERKQAEEALRKSRDELEVRVSERTQELTKTNEALQKEIEERERAEVQMRAYLARVEALARVAERLNRRLDLSTVLKTLCRETAQSLQSEACAVLLFDPDTYMLEYAADFGAPDELRDEFNPIPFELFEEEVKNGEMLVVIPDVQVRRGMPDKVLYERVDLRTTAAVPMFSDAHLVGVLITLTFGHVREFSTEELSLLGAFANQGAVSIANARLFEQVHAGRSRLQALSQKLVEVQEAERRHLSRELHDEIGGTLTGLKLDLEMITANNKNETHHELERALETVTLLMRQVRELSLDLRPSMLDDLGLLPALLHLFERYTCQTNVQVNLQHNGINRRFSPTIETTVYRVVQEALTNAARYAGVDHVAVRIWCMDSALEIQVQDQGVGFDVKTITETKITGGLTGIRERVLLTGGTLEIESAHEEGTQLSVKLPLHQDWIERRENDR